MIKIKKKKRVMDVEIHTIEKNEEC